MMSSYNKNEFYEFSFKKENYEKLIDKTIVIQSSQKDLNMRLIVKKIIQVQNFYIMILYLIFHALQNLITIL